MILTFTIECRKMEVHMSMQMPDSVCKCKLMLIWHQPISQISQTASDFVAGHESSLAKATFKGKYYHVNEK
jgi:hypothetical protein